MRRSPFLLLVLLLMLAALPAFAQESTTTIRLSSDYRITIPGGWEYEDADETGGVYMIRDDDFVGYAINPDAVSAMIDVDADALPAEVLVAVYDARYEGDPPNAAVLPKLRFGGRTGASWTFELQETNGTLYDAMLIALPLNDGRIGVLEFTAVEGGLGNPLQDLRDLLLSFERVEAPAGNAADQPCIVMAEAANSAALRVGPGFNRTSVAFLPTNVEVEVTGSFSADDGSEWFQLNKAQAAPQSAANEIWVLREDVTESGGCDAVVTASAPPIVPILAAPPTPAPGSAAGSQPAVGLLMPLPGSWTQRFASEVNASCLGSENVVIPVEDVYEPLVLTNPMTVRAGGDSFEWANDVYTRISNTNTFEGEYHFANGGSAIMTLTLTSTTQLTGSLVDTYQWDDGTWCSDTTLVTLSRGR